MCNLSIPLLDDLRRGGYIPPVVLDVPSNSVGFAIAMKRVPNVPSRLRSRSQNHLG